MKVWIVGCVLLFLLVEVTHSQNWFHAEAPERCWRVAVMRTVEVSSTPTPKGGRGTDGRTENRLGLRRSEV